MPVARFSAPFQPLAAPFLRSSPALNNPPAPSGLCWRTSSHGDAFWSDRQAVTIEATKAATDCATDPAQSLAPSPRAPNRYPVDAYLITSPLRVTSRADIASALRAHRVAMGMTCEQFDAAAGWSDRYTTKLEHGPERQISGKRGFHIVAPCSDNPEDGPRYSGTIAASFMADVWLQTARLALVLMPEDQARAIGAVERRA